MRDWVLFYLLKDRRRPDIAARVAFVRAEIRIAGLARHLIDAT